MLAVEDHVLTEAARRHGTGVAQLDAGRVDDLLATRGDLADEQAAMVRSLTASGDGVQVVRAAAGTGKTRGLSAARDAWEAEGVRVFGSALAARAAVEMETLAGIDSTTIARLLIDVDQGNGLAQGAVLVVDEADMVGSHTIDRLAKHAADTESKLVLVGDDRQLPEIDAGGAFRRLARDLGAIELHQVHRQAEAWDREALAELRQGDVRAWSEAYRDHGRLVARPTADELRATLVEDWWEAARRPEAGDAVMLAHRRSDVADLNALARERMARGGRLGEDELITDRRAFAVGDRVIARRNDRRAGIVNGTRGEVVGVDMDARSVAVRVADGTERTLASQYLDDGWLDHAYALTAHAAQGATVDRSFVLGSDELYREWGYTALSRHRDQARFYVVSPGSVERALPGLEPQDDALGDDVVAMLSPSRRKELALEMIDRAAHDRVQRARDEAQGEIAAARKRIEAMRAEQAELGRLRRSRRSAIEQDIARQEEALERWLIEAEEIAAAPVLDVAPPRIEHEATSPLDPDAARIGVLDPDAEHRRALGARPASFHAREAWTREAVALIGHDAAAPSPSAEPAGLDDVGLDL
jgi:AAA domain